MLIASILEGNSEADKVLLYKEFSFDEWLSLSDQEKRYIYKKLWNPIHPEVGARTREEILERFKQSIDIPSEDIVKMQYGYFGACVGAIHIILKKPYKVPSHFAWLPVNKGVLCEDSVRWRWTL